MHKVMNTPYRYRIIQNSFTTKLFLLNDNILTRKRKIFLMFVRALENYHHLTEFFILYLIIMVGKQCYIIINVIFIKFIIIIIKANSV